MTKDDGESCINQLKLLYNLLGGGKYSICCKFRQGGFRDMRLK